MLLLPSWVTVMPTFLTLIVLDTVSILNFPLPLWVALISDSPLAIVLMVKFDTSMSMALVDVVSSVHSIRSAVPGVLLQGEDTNGIGNL